MICNKCKQSNSKTHFSMTNSSFINVFGNICDNCYPIQSNDLDKEASMENPMKVFSGEVKFNGTEQISSTGSLRYNKGKAGIHQIPPEVLLDIAKVLDYGATKYSQFNWAKGNNLSVPYSCAMRHLLAFWGGEDTDKESGEPHLAHVLTNIVMMMYYQRNFDNFDDRFFKKEDK